MTDNMIYLADAFRNLASGLGTTSERATSGAWYPDYYVRQPLLDAYSSNWFAARLVDVFPDELNRCWRKITTPSMDAEQIQQFQKAERRIKLKSHLVNAWKWARLFGGGGIYIVVEQDQATPLVPSLRRGAPFNIVVFDRDDINVNSLYAATLSNGYDMPATYTTRQSGEVIHSSRFIRFDGRTLPRDCWERNNYWGGSHLAPLLGAVERCDTVTRALAQLADEANIDVIGVPDLFSKIVNAQTLSALQTRFSEGNIVKSLYKIMLRDTKEEYTRHELSGSLSGLVELLKVYYEIPAAGVGAPVTKLLGISPGGLNATGESDLENYYDMVDITRGGLIADALDVIDPLICQVEFGRTFPDWEYEWVPLWQEDRATKTNSDKARAETIIEVRDAGIITPAMAAEQLSTDGIFSVIDAEYIDDLKALEAPDSDDDAAEPDPNAAPIDGVTFTGGDANVQKQALNGAQVESLVGVATKVKSRELTKEQALGIMSVAFPSIGQSEANAIVNVDFDTPIAPPATPAEPPATPIAPPATLAEPPAPPNKPTDESW